MKNDLRGNSMRELEESRNSISFLIATKQITDGECFDVDVISV
jgi:hypothetical protein